MSIKKLSKFALAAAVVFAGYSSTPAMAGEEHITEHNAKKFLQQLKSTVNNKSPNEAYDFLNLHIANYQILGTERLAYDNRGYLLNNVYERNDLRYRRYPGAPFGQYNSVSLVDFTKAEFISSILEKKTRTPGYALHINVENVRKISTSSAVATIDLRETSAAYGPYNANNPYDTYGFNGAYGSYDKRNWSRHAQRRVDSLAKCNVRLENYSSGIVISRIDCSRT